MKHVLIATVIGLIMLGGSAAMGFEESYIIPHGSVTVDGDLSEWTPVDVWHDLDEAYSGVAADLSNAKYAARWNDAANLIYVAVTGEDTDQVFKTNHDDWNGQDSAEIYFEASADGKDYGSAQGWAQQYVMSSDGAGGAWAVLGGGSAVPTGLNFAATVVGDVVTYEIAMTPYMYYTGLGGAAATESIRDLEPGQIVGLDIVMDSRTAAGDFAMSANNTVGGKHKWASSFQHHELLIPEPASMSLLALGALAMLRKRR